MSARGDEPSREPAAHAEQGVHALLERPWLYRWLQNLLGARRARRTLVAEYVRPSAGCRLLDVGCGPADLLEELPPDVRYTGYDINPAYVDAARARYGERGRFLVGGAGEIADERLEGPFDRILLVALLHHLDDAPAARVLGQCRRLLAPDGCLVTFDNARVERQSRVARLLIDRDRGARVRRPDQYLELLRAQFETVEGEVRHDLLRVPYTHFVARAAATAGALSR